MKTIVLIEDGFVQLVLQPESAFERDLVRHVERDQLGHVTIQTGEFYHNSLGYMRQGSTDQALIVSLRRPTPSTP